MSTTRTITTNQPHGWTVEQITFKDLSELWILNKKEKIKQSTYINFHCLRHTFATTCVRAGFDIKTLSEILGHSSVSFTMNQYVHSDIEKKRKQMNLLNNYLF